MGLVRTPREELLIKNSSHKTPKKGVLRETSEGSLDGVG